MNLALDVSWPQRRYFSIGFLTWSCLMLLGCSNPLEPEENKIATFCSSIWIIFGLISLHFDCFRNFFGSFLDRFGSFSDHFAWFLRCFFVFSASSMS